MSLIKILTQGLTISGLCGIIMCRKGVVYVDGIQRTDPMFKINKPTFIHAGEHRMWVSPAKDVPHEQESISQPY